MKHFHITEGKGFQMLLPNGYLVSIQWGWGNYCDHYNNPDHLIMGGNGPDLMELSRKCGAEGSDRVETAVTDPQGSFVPCPLFPGDDVQPYMTNTQVIQLILWAMMLEFEE